MQCIVFTMVVTKTQCGCGGEAHFRCRRGSCLPDVSKLQQNMGGRPELGLSRSKANSIFVQKEKTRQKNNKRQDQSPTYQETKTGRNKTQCQLCKRLAGPIIPLSWSGLEKGFNSGCDH